MGLEVATQPNLQFQVLQNWTNQRILLYKWRRQDFSDPFNVIQGPHWNRGVMMDAAGGFHFPAVPLELGYEVKEWQGLQALFRWSGVMVPSDHLWQTNDEGCLWPLIMQRLWGGLCTFSSRGALWFPFFREFVLSPVQEWKARPFPLL